MGDVYIFHWIMVYLPKHIFLNPDSKDFNFTGAYSHPNTYLKTRFSWLHSEGWGKPISRDQKSKSVTIHLSKQLLRHIIAACTTGEKAILQCNQITGPHSCFYQDQQLKPTIWTFSIHSVYLYSREFPNCFNRMTNQRLAFIIWNVNMLEQ